jgi:hypothetical protein
MRHVVLACAVGVRAVLAPHDGVYAQTLAGQGTAAQEGGMEGRTAGLNGRSSA